MTTSETAAHEAAHETKTLCTPALETLLELEPAPVDTQRILARTTEKLNEEDERETAYLPLRPTRPTRPFRKPLRRWKAVLVAAAIVVMLPLLMGAGFFLAVGENPIDYIFKNSSPDEVLLEEGGIRIHGIEIPGLEQFNASVGETVTCAGVSVTFDSIAIDDNFVEVFFTYQFDEPVDLATAVDKGFVAADAINQFIPQPTVSLNGEMVGAPGRASKESSSYFADDEKRTVKQVTRFLIPGWLPDNLEVAATLAPYTSNYVYVSALPEPVAFNTWVDKSAASASTRSVEPGQYTFETAAGARILDIEKLAVTPSGAVLSLRPHWTDEGVWDPNYLQIQDLEFSSPGIPHIARFSYSEPVPGDDLIFVELLAADTSEGGWIDLLPLDIIELTITPLKESVVGPNAHVSPDGVMTEARIYELSNIGVDIPVSPTGGLILKDVTVKDNRLTIRAETYGDCKGAELISQDEGITSLNAQNRSGLRTSDYNPESRIFTQTTEYYAATEDEIKSITQIAVLYNEDIGYDKAAAKTFKFNASGRS
jgi:hypothetical protein